MNVEKLIQRTAIAVFLLCIASIAQAQTTCSVAAANRAHVCWGPVTTYTAESGGGTIDATKTVQYIVWKLNVSTWVNQDATTATDWTSPVLPVGTHTYAVTATVDSIQSARSNSGVKVVAPATPSAPVLIISLTVNADGTVTMRQVAGT